MTLKEIAARLEKLEGKVDALLSQAKIVPLLVKWVIFPLVSILGAAYGIKTIVS